MPFSVHPFQPIAMQLEYHLLNENDIARIPVIPTINGRHQSYLVSHNELHGQRAERRDVPVCILS